MRLKNALRLALILPVAIAPWVQAQNEPKKSDTGRFGNPTSIARNLQDYLYGVIKKIDDKSNELVLDKTKFGIDQTVKLDAKTKYIHDGKPSALSQLKPGDQVYVDVRKDKKTGDRYAKKVVSGVPPTP